MNEELKPFVGGFQLAGRRLANGKLQAYCYNNDIIDEWPENVQLFDNNYTLEDVIKGVNGYESAVYA